MMAVLVVFPVAFWVWLYVNGHDPDGFLLGVAALSVGMWILIHWIGDLIE